MTFTRESFTAIRADLDAALNAVGAKHGFGVSLGGIRFTADSFHVKLTATSGATSSEDARVKGYEADWHRYTPFLHPLVDGDLGAHFTVRGGDFTIVGYAPKRSKYPVVCKRSDDGKCILFAVESVARALGRGDKVAGF